MNSTQRVLAAINFGKPDRIPRWDTYWPSFVRDWRSYMGRPNEVPADYYAIDMNRLVANELFFPSEAGVVSEDGEWTIVRDGWGRVIRQRKGWGNFSETLESVLDDPAGIDDVEFEPTDLPSRYAGLECSIAKMNAAGRCILTKIGGIYVRSQFIRGEEKLLVDMAVNEGFCHALFDKVAAHLTGMALETLNRTRSWDVGLQVYDDMANTNSTMFSPAMFEKYLLPRYRKLVGSVRSAGCKHVFFHSDGNIMPVMDMLVDAGFDGFHPMEPRCGYDLPKLRERYGKRVVFLGNVCNTRILPGGDKAEIERHIRPLIEMAREGGLILGSASIGDDISPEIYDYYQSLLSKLGVYE